MGKFKDHFSPLADGYARYRPGYPKELFEWLASKAPGRQLAWDCACGNGQATRGLAPLFEKVIGTDASEEQIEKSEGPINVFYQVAREDDPFLPDGAVDLVTCAQAAHWLDLEKFFTTAKAKLKPGGVMALWSYALFESEPEIEALVVDFYKNTVGPFWPPERRWVESGYEGMDFPFEPIEAPNFVMAKTWTREELMGYLGTWSAVKEYQKEKGEDPRTLIEEPLKEIWGETGRRGFSWAINLKVGRA